MYIESGKVKFYPSAYRQYQDGTETKNINPESELNTEYNITSHIAKLLKKNKGSFIVDYVENVRLEFYLGGYYIHITSPQDILGAFSNSTEIWANMKVAPFTPTDTTKGFSELYEVVDYGDSGKNIDELNNNIVSFKGVAFLSTKDNNATFSLCLFTREDADSPWDIYEQSNYILDSSEIGNTDSTHNIAQEFDTDELSANQGNIGYATIDYDLDVKGDALFEQQVKFESDLVPTSGSQIDIGRSANPIANIYTSSISAYTIYLKSQIIPDGTVTIGLANKPITNIYATNIYGTALKEVNEIDGGQNSITLKSDVFPDANITLGNSSNKFVGVYATNLYGDYAEISIVNAPTIKTAKIITPTSSGTISLHNTLVPNSSNQYIGLSTKPFSNIYATTFRGALTGNVNGNVTGNLTGNASTATKLNGTDAGGTKNPVYFDDGVPTASLYNSDLYDRIERESTFQNIVTLNPNTRAFDIEIPSVTTDNKVYMNMFALININGDKCSFNFVANSPSTTSSPTSYSNHILAYGVIYRLNINGPHSGGTGVRYSVSLQYNNNTSASDSDRGWTTVGAGSEVVQSIVVHYTVR